jgi:uncharacterized protein
LLSFSCVTADTYVMGREPRVKSRASGGAMEPSGRRGAGCGRLARWVPSLLLLIVLTSPLRALASEPAFPAPRPVFLWEVQPAGREGGTLYLLGSTHTGRKPVENLDPVIENAFTRADSLIVEVDTRGSDPDEISKYATRIGQIDDGTTLRAWVPEDVYHRVRETLRQQRMRPETLDACEPWFAALMLSGSALSRMGYDSSFGIDEYFLGRAQHKKVIELEGAQAQLKILDTMSVQMQNVMLSDTLRELDELDRTVRDLFASWEAGDADRMNALIFARAGAGPDSEAFYEQIYFARNRSMTGKLASSLDQGGVWFAVIGAGHLLGGKGIPALLRERGYQVRQLDSYRLAPSVSDSGAVGPAAP